MTAEAVVPRDNQKSQNTNTVSACLDDDGIHHQNAIITSPQSSWRRQSRWKGKELSSLAEAQVSRNGHHPAFYMAFRQHY